MSVPAVEPPSPTRPDPPTTGDAEVDLILTEFVHAGASVAQAQVEAAATAQRRLQARLSEQ